MTMVKDLKINAGIIMMKESNVKRNFKIGVSTIKTEPHAAPKSLILSRDGWMPAILINLHSTISKTCLTNLLIKLRTKKVWTTGNWSKTCNGLFN